MRLRRLDLIRYGKFTDRTIDFGERIEGEPDLHIVYGPNEAGKSTAFAGYLDLLFGIEMQSRYGFIHGYDTMRIGGRLDLSLGARELVRVKKPQPTLRDVVGSPVAEGLVLGDLGGLDRAAYRTMFSLDDDSLEAGGKSILASNGELGQLLFSASAGLSELSKTLVDLRSETDGFTKPARSSELHHLKATLAALKQQRDEIDTLASEYNRLAAARDGAASAYASALDERAQAQADLEKVRRRLAALPRMGALRRLREQIKRLDDVPVAPTGWLAELPELQRDDARHRSAIGLAEADAERVSEERRAVIVDDRHLALVGRLDRLIELRARHVTAELDLPSRRRELSRLDGEVGGTLLRLGRQNEARPDNLLLDAAQTSALQALIVSRSGVAAQVTAAADELSQALLELTEAHCALHEAAAPASAPSMPAVNAVLAAVRGSDHAVRCRAASRFAGEQREALATLLAALTPWTGSIEQLAALSLPAAASVEGWRMAGQKDDVLVAQRGDEVERFEAESARIEAELDAIGGNPEPLKREPAIETRTLRESAWAEHRRVLDLTTADAFETALRRDDLAVDGRLGSELHAAKLLELGQALAGKKADATRSRTLLGETVARASARSDEIARATTGIGPPSFVAPSPDWLSAWMARRERALEIWGQVRAAERDSRNADADAAELRKRLAEALEGAGVAFDPDAGIDDLAITAQTAVDREAEAQALRRTVANCQREVRKREAAVQKASILDKAWRGAWREACSSCWLGAGAAEPPPLDVVREMLTALEELRRTLHARRDLADRIRGMEDDQAAFADELAQLIQSSGIDPGQQAGEDLAQTLVDRVQEAGRSKETTRRLGVELAAAEAILRRAKAEALSHARRVEAMAQAMGVETLPDLAAKLPEAARKADLLEQVAEAEREIVAALRVRDLAEADAMLEHDEGSVLEVEHARLTAHLEEFEARTRELFAASKQAADRIAAVGGDDAAARIEERRRTKLLEIEEQARRHLKLRSGIAAAEWGLRAYRDRHRSSMMTEASDAFSIISRGAYLGLRSQPDREGDVLVALPRDGGSKLAADLSKGTRFQLYLALRAAGYREFAKSRRPVPFIADDIMETFDDLRAEETLRVFEGMARLGQVIYLTHHDHLRALAERTVPGVRVHELVA